MPEAVEIALPPIVSSHAAENDQRNADPFDRFHARHDSVTGYNKRASEKHAVEVAAKIEIDKLRGVHKTAH